MIKTNKHTVTVSKDDFNDLIEELASVRKAYREDHFERSFMIHFIRYYNLQKLYEAFKASPPEDDPDDLPFDSYKN